MQSRPCLIARRPVSFFLACWLAVCGLGAVACAAQSVGGEWTPQELAALDYVQQHTGKKAMYKLNIGDPQQKTYLMALLRHAGITAQVAPHTMQMLQRSMLGASNALPQKVLQRSLGDANCTAPDICESDVQGIQFVVPDATAQNLLSSALSSVQGGTQSTSIVLSYRVGSNAPFATSVGAQYGQGTNFVKTLTAPLPSGVQPSSVVASLLILVNGITPYTGFDDGSSTYATSVCSTAPNYGSQQGPTAACPTVPATCIDKGSISTNIVSCYGRTGADCNYVWGGSQYPTVVPLTVAGTMTFAVPIALTNGVPSGTYTMNIQYPNQGGGCYLFPSGSTQGTGTITATNFAVPSGSPNQLNFCFQASSFVNQNCLQSAGAGPLTNLNLSVNPNLTVSSGSSIGTGIISSQTVSQPQSWYAQVPQIKIYQGCFAPGTRIQMADGTLKAIETFKGDGSEKVLSSNGVVRTVLSKTTGVEKHMMYRLTDSAGHTVVLTEMHPVPTAAGVKLAFQVGVGDVLMTAKGPSKVTSAVKVPSTGTVFNLAVGDQATAEKAESTVLANGLVMGDAAMQQYFVAKAGERGFSKEDVLKRLDPEWREEYLNSLQKPSSK